MSRLFLIITQSDGTVQIASMIMPLIQVFDFQCIVVWSRSDFCPKMDNRRPKTDSAVRVEIKWGEQFSV